MLLALETGLPMVLFTEGLLCLPEEFEEARPPWIRVVQMEKVPGSRVHFADCVGHVKERFGIPAGDLMCITDRSTKDIDGIECRTVAPQDAAQVLDALSHTRRHAAFAGYQEITPGMAHTVLVPLDLGIGATPDANLLCDHRRLKFDTVLLMEGLVPTSGFAAKSLEKLIAGYAPIVYRLADERSLAEIFRDSLTHLSAAGACRIDFVSEDGKPDEQMVRYVDITEKLGFRAKLLSWVELVQLRRVGI
ncbi:hypothetical protein [Yoonia sp. 2307UL14-13]|uniref:hypothetical protein n=1 Tax=Yoonia sp. 2307UL14-13 TaxID=3126506 RepID=UPI0030A892A6